MTGRLNAIDLPEDVALFTIHVLGTGGVDTDTYTLLDIYHRLDTAPFPFDDDDLPSTPGEMIDVLATLEQGYQIHVDTDGRIGATDAGEATLRELLNDVDPDRAAAVVDALWEAYHIDAFESEMLDGGET